MGRPIGLRGQAKLRGEKFYSTDVPCANGHLVKRRTSDGHCVACNVVQMRARYAADPDKFNEASRKYREAHPERKAGGWRRWEERNPELAKKARIDSARRFQKNKPERALANGAAYRERHRPRLRILWSLRQSEKREQISRDEKTLTLAERVEIALTYEAKQMMEEMTGVKLHVDHIIPLSKGGRHHPSNLAILTARDNISKGAKLNWRRGPAVSLPIKKEFSGSVGAVMICAPEPKNANY